MYLSYIEINVLNDNVVIFNIINDVKRIYLEEWFFKDSKEKFVSEFLYEFNNNVNMFFKYFCRLFCYGDDCIINVNVKDWVMVKFILLLQNGLFELLIIVCVLYEIYKNFLYMKLCEVNKYNKMICFLIYNFCMLLFKMDVVEFFDDNMNYGFLLFEIKVVIKLKDFNKFKFMLKFNYGNDIMKEECEYFSICLIEVEKQIEEYIKVFKDLIVKVNGLCNVIEVLK